MDFLSVVLRGYASSMGQRYRPSPAPNYCKRSRRRGVARPAALDFGEQRKKRQKERTGDGHRAVSAFLFHSEANEQKRRQRERESERKREREEQEGDG